MSICIGDKFASYDSFRAKVQEIERSTNCMFVIESSKTIESTNELVKMGGSCTILFSSTGSLSWVANVMGSRELQQRVMEYYDRISRVYLSHLL